jgi:hypothetical protein
MVQVCSPLSDAILLLLFFFSSVNSLSQQQCDSTNKEISFGAVLQNSIEIPFGHVDGQQDSNTINDTITRGERRWRCKASLSSFSFLRKYSR